MTIYLRSLPHKSLLNDKSKCYVLFFKQRILNFENHDVYNKYIAKFCCNLNFFVHKINIVKQGQLSCTLSENLHIKSI